MKQLKMIWAIIEKDLVESLRNKTILIVLLLPLFASLLFAVLSGVEGSRHFDIGVIEKDGQLGDFIEENTGNLKVRSVKKLNSGKKLLKRGEIDSLIVRTGKKDYKNYINSQRSLKYFILKENLESIISKFMKIEPELNLQFIPVNTSRAAQALLPTWMTISIAMIGILIISGNLAEEKENKTLDAIRISPISGFNILVGKGIFGVLLSFFTVFIMLIVNWAIPDFLTFLGFIIIVIIASILFSAIGLLIGILVKTQTAARSLGTIIYFPMIFPAFVYDLSDFTHFVAKFFPSYYLYRGLEKIFLLESNLKMIVYEIKMLIFFSFLFLVLEYFIFSKVVKYES
ncbi:MAG: ABC transporter permease [Halanaerobiaceae bacterium]